VIWCLTWLFLPIRICSAFAPTQEGRQSSAGSFFPIRNGTIPAPDRRTAEISDSALHSRRKSYLTILLVARVAAPFGDVAEALQRQSKSRIFDGGHHRDIDKEMQRMARPANLTHCIVGE